MSYFMTHLAGGIFLGILIALIGRVPHFYFCTHACQQKAHEAAAQSFQVLATFIDSFFFFFPINIACFYFLEFNPLYFNF